MPSCPPAATADIPGTWDLCAESPSTLASLLLPTVLLCKEKKPNPCTHQDPLSLVPEILEGKIAQTCSFLTGPNKVRPKLSMQLSGGGWAVHLQLRQFSGSLGGKSASTIFELKPRQYTCHRALQWVRERYWWWNTAAAATWKIISWKNCSLSLESRYSTSIYSRYTLNIEILVCKLCKNCLVEDELFTSSCNSACLTVLWKSRVKAWTVRRESCRDHFLS